ncbi:hypothetical protein JKP88DRAFT_252791 [Tribonema minus]|uniref:Uncharacterized protein n=1 Tax=Tribonema minus TaxID=303371 RepID=A0A835ZBU7_9STRA|nr:hypothetical protein JKP88DRAFT_252791 [Tribonema minus]
MARMAAGSAALLHPAAAVGSMRGAAGGGGANDGGTAARIAARLLHARASRQRRAAMRAAAHAALHTAAAHAALYCRRARQLLQRGAMGGSSMCRTVTPRTASPPPPPQAPKDTLSATPPTSVCRSMREAAAGSGTNGRALPLSPHAAASQAPSRSAMAGGRRGNVLCPHALRPRRPTPLRAAAHSSQTAACATRRHLPPASTDNEQWPCCRARLNTFQLTPAALRGGRSLKPPELI